MTDTPACSVEICIASYNTRSATELCLRSIRRTVPADVSIVVGDSASEDGSAEMIRSFAKPHHFTAEIVAEPRRHHEWLDHWYSVTDADYLVFADSDMDFRSVGWIDNMLATSRAAGAALVAGRFKQANLSPGGNYSRHAERPEVHLTSLDMNQLRGTISTSFAWYEEPDPERAGLKLGYDVGSLFMKDLRAAGLAATEMPSTFSTSYRHWGRLSHWQDGEQTKTFMAKTVLKRLRLYQRLVVERLRDRVPGKAGPVSK